MTLDTVTFNVYKARCGELSQEEFVAVTQHNYSGGSYSLAFARLTLAGQDGCAPCPTRDDIEAAAKLIGALGERVPRDDADCPHATWLLTEAYIMQGKDTARIQETVLKNARGG